MLSLQSGTHFKRFARNVTTSAKKAYPRMKVRDKASEMIPKYQHPWVYNASLASKPPAGLESGAVIDLVNSSGQFLARGTYSADSRMSVRVLTYDEDEKIDGAFWRRRIRESLARRKSLPSLSDEKRTNAYRVINAESDRLPGLVVDKYGEWYTVQVQNAGIEFHRNDVFDALVDVLKPASGIYERSDESNRRKDGLAFRKGLVYPAGGQNPPKLIEIVESGRRFYVDLVKGHKTGFYLDQRENRNIISQFCEGKDVLNCFSYSGGFSIAALQGGAKSVLNVDSSAEALEIAERNLELNGYPTSSDTGSRCQNREANVFDYLRELEQDPSHSKFDLIILDPPKFSASTATVNTAARGYKDINRLAMKLLRPGGVLATFSCSASVDHTLFRQIVSSASIEAEQPMQILQQLGQPADHPIGISFPEALYLKGLLLKAL
jgi:23S rRNA (cytosine1962-C5)-methyltransferase